MRRDDAQKIGGRVRNDDFRNRNKNRPSRRQRLHRNTQATSAEAGICRLAARCALRYNGGVRRNASGEIMSTAIVLDRIIKPNISGSSLRNACGLTSIVTIRRSL